MQQGSADATNGLSRLAVAHVTHEAIEQLGGIGTVLEGLIASPSYQQDVDRSILIGLFAAEDADGLTELRASGEVVYASHLGVDDAGLSSILGPVAERFQSPIVFGRRRYDLPGQARQGEADVLLIDIRSIDAAPTNAIKGELWNRFGLDCAALQDNWDCEQWIRLAGPAFAALDALVTDSADQCVVLAHEFMGVPTALVAQAAQEQGDDRYRSLFYAHECSTARAIVENHPGHDARFYGALNHPEAAGRSIESLFGDQSHLGRHCLIKHTHRLHGVLAVGQDTAQEMHRLTDSMQAHANVHLAYNGLPAFRVTPGRKEACREQLQDYAEALTGQRPDLLLTHVTRPVISKGLWRDAALLQALAPLLEEAGLTACYFLLTSAGGVRDASTVRRMEEAYGWPRHHRHGWADLVGPEDGLYHMFESVNSAQSQTTAVVINQFGFSTERVGQRVPEGMNIADFRIATDIELGMATYEPFGISPLEPLAAGAVCVISQVCGCAGFVRAVTGDRPCPNVLMADYTAGVRDRGLQAALHTGQTERDAIEHAVHTALAEDLLHRVPSNSDERAEMLQRGQALVEQMNWDRAYERGIQPVLADLWATHPPTHRGPTPAGVQPTARESAA